MNRIIASVGLVALGAASVQAQSTGTGPAAKWWNVSATVRGFYDDNANTAPDGSEKTRTFGYELSPSVGVSLGNDQTTFSASYVFSYLYYEKRLASTVINPVTGLPGRGDKSDMDHTFNAALDHNFSERYSLHVGDSFVIGQQPDTLRAGNSVVAFYRISGNNIVNSGTIAFDAHLTPLLDMQIGYNNALYNYDAPQLSGPLNRVENLAHVDLRWQVVPSTTAVLGYQFGDTIYTGSGTNAIIGVRPPASPINVDERNAISHTLYVGADHTFLPNLVGSVRVGASYYDYYNDADGKTSFGPYAQASLMYSYAPESSISVGFQEGRNASSVVGNGAAAIVHDTETSVVYGTLVHRIVPKLYGSIKGTFENSTYNGGGNGIDGKSERFYEAEVDFEYRFTPHFSAHVGYDYDKLDSESNIAPSYDRNKVYIGATASY